MYSGAGWRVQFYFTIRKKGARFNRRQLWQRQPSSSRHGQVLFSIRRFLPGVGRFREPILQSERINREKRNSKNYVLFLGETNVETNQAPCLSLVQFQIEDGRLLLTAYQRSSDASLGLPSDIYHLYLISRQVDLPLHSITLFLGNVHIYENNIEKTRALLNGEDGVKFELNV